MREMSNDVVEQDARKVARGGIITDKALFRVPKEYRRKRGGGDLLAEN